MSSTGVVNAIFDGACLVNLIHDLPSNPSMRDISDTFQTYFERRYPVARIAIEGSIQFSKLFNDQSQVEEDGEVVMFNSVPRWLQRWTLDKTNKVDPKLQFTRSEILRSPLLRPTPTDDSISIDQLMLGEANDIGKEDEAFRENTKSGKSDENSLLKEP
ncbi:hypothetical protein BGZ46_005935 [Entomortierella lignicola]|nr:hypothetical protein BGZ46_005935 [Entomortierella lignicola]